MALSTLTLFDGETNKVDIAISNLKEFCPEEGYYLAFSGGKDSLCCMYLLRIAQQYYGVKFDAHYNLTNLDPPELVRFIKDNFSSVEIHHPDKSMWQLIRDKGGLPTRLRRWCCATQKEGGGSGRVIVTGVRRAESSKRNGRRLVETCFKDGSKTYVNPIIDWSDEDVWEFIRAYNIPYPSLYDEGFKRLGCVGCPMGSKQKEEFARWPKLEAAWKRAAKDAYDKRRAEGRPSYDRWETFDDYWSWWLNDTKYEDPDQTVMFE